MPDSQEPFLSVVVVIASDTTQPRANVALLAQCLQGLANQIDAPETETIVPYLGPAVDGIDEIRQQFPEVRFLKVDRLDSWKGTGGSREHHDELKTLGLEAARGQIVGFLEDNEIPDERWCAETVKAHRGSFVGIGGAIDNRLDKTLNWAVYFCDFGRYQNPVIEGTSLHASDANVSYKRDALEAVRPVWERGFNEVTVNAALMSQGGQLALSPRIIVYQHRQGLSLGAALRERYVWGRSFGSVRCQVMSGASRFIYAALSPVLPLAVALKITKTVLEKRRNAGKYWKALPLIVLLLTSWGWGEFLGYLTGRPAR